MARQPSYTVAGERVTKIPSKAAISKWKPLTDACIAAILASPSRKQNKAYKTRIILKNAKNWKAPDNFPIGRIEKKLDNYEWRSYTHMALLVWLYENRYSEYSPTMLFRARQGVMQMIETIEKGFVDIAAWLADNTKIDIDEEFDE